MYSGALETRLVKARPGAFTNTCSKCGRLSSAYFAAHDGIDRQLAETGHLAALTRSSSQQGDAARPAATRRATGTPGPGSVERRAA
jgi:hypothetical protein